MISMIFSRNFRSISLPHVISRRKKPRGAVKKRLFRSFISLLFTLYSLPTKQPPAKIRSRSPSKHFIRQAHTCTLYILTRIHTTITCKKHNRRAIIARPNPREVYTLCSRARAQLNAHVLAAGRQCIYTQSDTFYLRGRAQQQSFLGARAR